MGLFKKLLGTTSSKLHIGGPLKSLFKIDAVGIATWFKARNFDDTEYVHVMGQWHAGASGSVDDDNLAAQVDVKGYFPLIDGSFDGGSPPSFTNEQFYMCHTSGGSYTQGRIYYKKSDSATPYEMDPTYLGGCMTSSAISGDISFEADWLYGWDGSTWVKKCDLSGDGAGKQYIAIPIGVAATYSSTAQVPTGGVVTDVIVDITTAYSDNTRVISVEVDSNTIVNGNDVWEDVAHEYHVEDITPIAAADVGTVNISGTAGVGTGAGVVYIGYVTPKV